jgi:hypothetical protein
MNQVGVLRLATVHIGLALTVFIGALTTEPNHGLRRTLCHVRDGSPYGGQTQLRLASGWRIIGKPPIIAMAYIAGDNSFISNRCEIYLDLVEHMVHRKGEPFSERLGV